MYLKEIRASGFKSFADKISLNLNDQITCIVGPNGSGKSNVVDAVKWVLGEQSVKNLRGSNNMADVIFSGSKTRNPLNVASVTLLFDNTDSYLKVPYTDISVTRKVYRNGENEYFINDKKCRLKDINDMFLDSGIGKYAFNIISQGEVSNIINSSPYERRTIFEEAAGVLKYKKRKEEALKKLEKTNENIIRIKDIMMELNNQIEPLKLQKQEAEAYLSYKEKLSNIEIALIVSDLEKLDSLYDDNNRKIASLQDEIAELMSKSTTSDLDIEKRKKELSIINEKLSQLNNEYINLTRELERLNGEKNILSERSKYESTDIKVHENVVHLKEQNLSLKNNLIAIENDIKLTTEDILKNQKELEKANLSAKSKKEELELLNKKIETKNKEIIDISYKIKALTDYIDQGAGVPLSVKKVLTSHTLKGIHNTISNLIEVEEEYLTALTVALASSKDYVVVDSPIYAKNTIKFLKENNLGRVTFYPLDVIKPRYIDNDTLLIVKSANGFINTMDKIVTYDNKYENIIKNRLGSVILVDNLDNANKLRDLTNNRYMIVTLTGEVINVGGSITGGKLKTNSIINEKHELQRIKNLKSKYEIEKQEYEDKLTTLSKEYQNCNKESFELEKKCMILEEEKKSKQANYSLIKEKYEKSVLELSNLNGLNTLKNDEEKVMEKYYEVMSEKEEVEKASKALLIEKEKIDIEIENLEVGYRMASSNIRNLEEKLKNCEISNSKASVKMDTLLNTLSETYQMTFEKAKGNYILEIEEHEARTEVNKCKRALDSIGPVNLLAIDEYERVNTRYDFLYKQNNDLEAALKELLNIISELDEVMKTEFLRTFKQIQIEFDKVFKELFSGGEAKLELTDQSNLLECGINIIVTPPGKKLSSINLLSGGEKSLTAISLLFSILNLKQIPFCLFDEVEAALDEANVDRFGSYLQKYNNKTQLIIITHKKKTMEYANTLYGITMQESGVSKLVSVKLVDSK